MKNSVKMWMLVILLCGMIGCKKDSVQLPSENVYEQTITGIKKDEPVLLTFTNSNNATKVEWTVTPNIGVNKSEVGNYATLLFRNAGTYNVIAKAGSITAKYKLEVIDSTYKSYGSTFNLSAAKLVNINVGEPVLFSVHNAKQGVKIRWTANNTTSLYTINENAANNTATITFNSAGFGTVTASDGIDTEERTIWINDNATANPNEDTVSFILGEKLLLKPSIQMVGGNKQLVISATTSYSYHCVTDKILSYNDDANYIIDYAGVAIAKQPCSSENKATCDNQFTNIPVGDHPFIINFENKTYKGIVNVNSAGAYTFSWLDNSVIKISPLVVK